MNQLPKKSCHCENTTCGKCLGVGCQDDYCSVHRPHHKLRHKLRVLGDISAIVARLQEKINNGHSPMEMKKLYDYKRLPRLFWDFRTLSEEAISLQKLLKGGVLHEYTNFN